MISGTVVVYALTVLCVGGLIFSMWRDNRSLWNPPLLILSLIFGYITIASLAYNTGNDVLHEILFGVGFLLLPFMVFVSSFFLIYNGLVLLHREGFSKVNILSLVSGVLILVFFALVYIRATDSTGFFLNNREINIAFILMFFTFFVFGFAFAGFLLYSIVYAIIPKRKKYDFIIIHGAGLINGERVTPLLQRRIDKAIDAFKKSTNPDVMIIASGGKGGDEKVSEAQAIANYIFEETDVPRDKVILEDKSTTTYENLLFSQELGEKLVDNPRFLFVTNDYHVFRTSTFARRIGMNGDGLGCTTVSYYIPSAFIREFVAICVRYKWLFVTLYALMIGGLVLSYM